MDYHGTSGDDNIDQKALGLADWTNIYGGAGNDTIKIGNATAVGEAGDDTIIGTTHSSTVAYWGAPAGVTVNLATGIAQDGYGGTDHLSGIYVVQASPFSDKFIGSAGDETFWLSGGNDSVTGGGGHDKVIYYGMKASEATVTYVAATDTFTVVRNPANGDRGTDTLQGVEAIEFGGGGTPTQVVTRDMFVDQGGFRRSTQHVAVDNMSAAAQLRVGDFNGDGISDILISRINWSDVGVTPVPLQVFLGDGKGGFTDGTAQVFAGGSAYVHYVPRIFAADFNKDGVTDIFTPDFGVDGPPFPGGQNGLFLSSANHQLVNATSTLPQALRQNHGTSIGDVNGDGYPDILVNALNDSTGHGEDLLINDRTGHFVSSPSLLPAVLRSSANAAGHTWSMIRDLNGDGAGDIVLGTWDNNPNPSQVLLNDGHGSFANATPIDLPRSGVAREIVVGIETIDLNGDALPDLVLSVTNGGDPGSFYQVPYLQFLVNDGNGKFHDETQTRFAQSKTALPGAAPDWYLSTTVVDLNGDGAPDIVVDDAGGGPSKVLMNDGHGVFSVGWQSVAGAHVVVMDVDRDGMPDLIQSSANGFDVLYNTMPKSMVGTAKADTLHGAANGARIDGAGGLDTVVFTGAMSGYKVTHTASGFTVTKGTGTDTLVNVERLKFDDATVALDIDGVGGQAYRIYQAAFDRVPDSVGLGFWISAMDHGTSLASVAQGFVDSKEFKDMYGAAPSSADLVGKFYQHVLHRPAEKAGFDFWVGVLDSHAVSVTDVLVAISESAENQAALAPLIGNGFTYTPFG